MAFVYALASSPGSHDHSFYSGLVQQLFVPTVASLIALVFGVSAFGDEREDGTILYLVATPQPRIELAAAKIAAAWLATLILLVPSLVASGLLGLGVAPASSLIGWPLLGVLLASLAYCAAGAAVALHPPPGRHRGALHPALGKLDRDLRGVGQEALDLRVRAGLRGPRPAPVLAAVTGTAVSALVLAVVVAVAGWAAARALGRVELP